MEQIPMCQHHIKESTALLLLRVLFTYGIFETIYVAVLVFWTLAPNVPEFQRPLIVILLFLYLVKSVAQVIMLCRLITHWAATSYYINETQLIKHTGVLTIQEEVYDLTNLRRAHRHQSWLGKKLNYGTLRLELAYFGYNQNINLHGIRNPKKYLRIFEEHMLRHAPESGVNQNPRKEPFDNEKE